MVLRKRVILSILLVPIVYCVFLLAEDQIKLNPTPSPFGLSGWGQGVISLSLPLSPKFYFLHICYFLLKIQSVLIFLSFNGGTFWDVQSGGGFVERTNYFLIP